MIKKRNVFLDSPMMRIILAFASTIVAAGILVFSSLTIINIYNDAYETAPNYMLWIFLLLGLMSIITFFKKRNKTNFIKSIVLIVIDIALAIIVLFAKNNPFLFSLTAGAYCLSIIISRLFNMIQEKNIRSYILNGLIIAFAIAMAIGLLISPTEKDEQIQSLVLVECVFIAIVSFIEAMSIALANLKFKVLFKVIVSTYSLEVLFGLLVMIVCFSLVFIAIEPNMPTFAEALWYCFAVVTTIGFGDITAVTPIGRILTVVLGIYGLVVVAVITSIVVNFYNETNGKRDQKEIKEISKKDKE